MKATQTKQEAKRPTHYAYHVRDLKEASAIWTRIGSAWQHSDGKGFNILIDIMPLDGRISLRVPSPSDVEAL